jgi:Ca2+-binding RTX toxin-like protein
MLAGIENVVGSGLGDTIYGDDGDNRIAPGAGNDIIDGRGGSDTIDYSAARAPVEVRLDQGRTYEQGTGGFEIDYSSQNSIFGGRVWADDYSASVDQFTGIENAVGSAFDDILVGDGGVNRLEGGGGNDRIDGGAGADTMIGGTGNDIYIVDNAGDAVIEQANEGMDQVSTAIGSRSDYAALYTLPANVENLTGTSTSGQGVNGNALDNLVRMGAGGDLIVVEQGGNDRVESGGGNDYIYYGASFTNGDSNDGGAGVDTVGLLGNYTLTFDADDLVSIEKLAVYSSGNPAATNSYNLTTVDANVAAGEHLTVIGMSLSAAETLVFNGAAETDGRFTVLGGKGNDTITGGAGNDLIWGNLGADTLRGGGGNDGFEYYSIAESTPGARDTILDFSGGDKINLWGIDADGDASNGNSGFAFIGSGAFTGAAGQLRAVQDANFARAWIVEGDTDGDGQADFSLVVVTQPGYLLGAGDFIL